MTAVEFMTIERLIIIFEMYRPLKGVLAKTKLLEAIW